MSDEANIPVLTDVITIDAAEPPITPPVSNTLIATHNQSEAAILNPSLSEDQWRLLETQIRENVLKQVLARIDFVLEHRVRDNLADVLQTAVEGLANEVRTGLRNSLTDLVSRSLSQEINKIRSGQP